jgi:hypothetical protein
MARGLLHVNLFIHIPIEKGSGDIHLMKMKVQSTDKGQEGSDSRLASGRGKGFIKVNPFFLPKPLDHKPCLVSRDSSIRILLDGKDPFGSQDISSWRRGN